MLKHRILFLSVLLASGFFQYSCAALDYVRQDSASSANIHPDPNKNYHVTSLFGSLVTFDAGIEDLDPARADKLKNIHLEKDWFEDAVSLVTLGMVNPMEVKFGRSDDLDAPRPWAVTPFQLDLAAHYHGDSAIHGNEVRYEDKQSWNILGLIPIDSGIIIDEDRYCKGGIINEYKIEKPDRFDSAGDWITTILFSPVSSILFEIFTPSNLRVKIGNLYPSPFDVIGLGAIAPYEPQVPAAPAPLPDVGNLPTPT